MSSENPVSSEHVDSVQAKRTHFKIGSRKSKLAMVQSEYIKSRMEQMYPDFTFEIVNFDTKGDKILNIALPKIGDKGLFTKELEDALLTNRIDFVVHSLKDMPCQVLPDNLIISGVPEREDPSDSLVIAKRWVETKKSLDDFEENSIIGTSSLRRISQLKEKYPKLKFETIRGNLQTRMSKMDDEKKFDAIILATAGLKRMKYDDRISHILPPETCLHAVSQGALGVESRRNDFEVIRMLNRLNDEETLLRCIAERTFLAKLEGGCSAPIGVNSCLTKNSIILEGAVFDLEGTKRIQDRFEINFNDKSNACPIMPAVSDQSDLNETKNIDSPKRSFKDSNEENKMPKRVKVENSDQIIEPSLRHFCFLADLNIDENKMIKAELCGLHLAEKLKEKGADLLINEIKLVVHGSF